MPDASSADGLRRGPRVRAILHAARFTAPQKLLLLALNAWPFVHLAGIFAWVLLPAWPAGGRTLAAGLWLLAVPPLLGRLMVGRGLPTGIITVPSRDFFRWWTTWQLQMLFNRLPWIEELLRLLPGVYSTWLRLWGARIGRLTLWSPGVRISDRPLLRIGDDAVIGLDARLVGHFGNLDADGRVILTLGTVTVGDRTIVGGSALLGPGVVLESDQATEVLFLGTPAGHWRSGERVRPGEKPAPPSSPSI
jgi:hypothetical protein